MVSSLMEIPPLAVRNALGGASEMAFALTR